jgi:hypothetical protein
MSVTHRYYLLNTLHNYRIQKYCVRHWDSVYFVAAVSVLLTGQNILFVRNTDAKVLSGVC